MKQKKPKRPNIQLSSQDVEALLCALPLISYYSTGSDAQDEVNEALMLTATEKLTSKTPNFVPNEYRVIYTAVALAVNLDTYFLADEIDASWRSELRRHFFTLNRIYALTKDYIYE